MFGRNSSSRQPVYNSDSLANWAMKPAARNSLFNRVNNLVECSPMVWEIMLYSRATITIRIHIHNTCGHVVNNNDDFNERTNTLLYKNIPVTFYSRKVWCWLCVRGELETGTDCYILTQSSSDHSSTSFAFGWAAQPWIIEGCEPSVCKLTLNLSSCPQLTPTATRTDWPKLSLAGVI